MIPYVCTENVRPVALREASEIVVTFGKLELLAVRDQILSCRRISLEYELLHLGIGKRRYEKYNRVRNRR